MSWVPDWIKAIQLKPRFLFGIFAFGLLLLILPKSAADLFGIDDLRTQYRPYIGLATIAAFCFWLVQLWPIYQAWRNRQRNEAEILANIETLTEAEWRILRHCLSRNQRTVMLNIIDHPEGLSLTQKGILIRGGGAGNWTAWPHTIRDIAWEHLKTIRDSAPSEDAREAI